MFASFEKLNATCEIDTACASLAEPQAVLPLPAVSDPVLSAAEQMPRRKRSIRRPGRRSRRCCRKSPGSRWKAIPIELSAGSWEFLLEPN